MKITVIGTGYVGVVTAVIFADFGNTVVGLDIDPKRVETLQQGIPPIYEPRLDEFLERGINSGRLTFTTNYTEALEGTEVIFICVGTPQNDKGEVDTRFVEAACESIAKELKQPAILVLKSTVPPGIHKKLQQMMKQHSELNFEFASVPEFLREGSAIEDTLHPSRTVIGTKSKEAREKLLKLHEPLNGERVVTDIISAQMIKYAANGFLATKISFANAIARMCDLMGADVVDVLKGIGLDPRIGTAFLQPGLGFGGSCFPKDIKGLYHLADQVGYDFELLKEVDRINETQVEYVLNKVKKAVDSFKGKKIAVLGLAFKPETDDMREARSIVLIKTIQQEGANIVAYDPIATGTAKRELGDTITYVSTPWEAIKEADILMIVTEWNEFKKLDLSKVKNLMKGNIIVDGRNIYDPETVKQAGFNYIGVGRR